MLTTVKFALMTTQWPVLKRCLLLFFFVSSVWVVEKKTTTMTFASSSNCSKIILSGGRDVNNEEEEEDDNYCGCKIGYVEMRAGNDNMQQQQQQHQPTTTCVKIDVDDLWIRFQSTYEPIYYKGSSSDNTTIDDLTHAQQLRKSANFISIQNNRLLNEGSPYTLGLTPYSADSEKDVQQRAGFFYVNVTGTGDEIPAYDPPTVAAADIPKIIDWGQITSVKTQGRCGCSWAIAICGAIEGAAFVNNGYNKSTSFQQFISCNKRNLGCEGGSMTIGAIYASDNWFGGVTTLVEYPFLDIYGVTTEYCNLTSSTSSSSSPKLALEVANPIQVGGMNNKNDRIKTFNGRLELFKLALARKPIAVAMKSSCLLFSNYVSGILTDDGECACSDSTCLDHSVLMVAYDDTGDIPYYKLKNSWGSSWGEDGYFRVAQQKLRMERRNDEEDSSHPYGLFGILAEGIMLDAEQYVADTTTSATTPVAIDDDSSTVFPLWAIIVIVVVACSLCCCCSIFIVIWLRRQQQQQQCGEEKEDCYE